MYNIWLVVSCMDLYSSINSVKSLVSINWYGDPLLQISAGVHSTFDWPCSLIWSWFRSLTYWETETAEVMGLEWFPWTQSRGHLQHSPQWWESRCSGSKDRAMAVMDVKRGEALISKWFPWSRPTRDCGKCSLKVWRDIQEPQVLHSPSVSWATIVHFLK